MSADRALYPSGVVTFLFTDVEGSTGRWEADPDAMRAALAAHDAVLRTAIEHGSGVVFKHTGDGMCAAFASPRSALDAAVAAQRMLELPVRMGIATGEAELRDGDYFGPVLNRAARVMAAGHGGQILVADSTSVLLGGVDLISLGARRLRGVPTEVEIFQVRAAGLGEEFPPLRTADVSQGNLHRPTGALIGRESDVAGIRTELAERRLVTLTGTGGVGKTRLALEVGSRLAAEFPEGVWVFELAPVADPAAVPDSVAAVLGISQHPGMSLADSVATTMEGRSRLLVFDNCEHVLDAVADLISLILARSSTVRILATSREALGVGAEQVFAVAPLDVAAGADSAAVELFVERAHAVLQQFSLSTPDEVAAVVDICTKLEGIPLAIELAASRMASMTPVEVRDRLGHRFRLLVASGRGPSRHQTLRNAVAWSWDYLGHAEKALLEGCSVFAGGFDLQGACAVGGFDDEFAALDLLDSLVRKSMLITDRTSGMTRFSMLETIRQFAEEHLDADAAAAVSARAAHARYYAGRHDDILALWDSPRQPVVYEWLAVELPNLRTAFRWAADHDALDIAAPIAAYVGFLGVWAEIFEPISWAEELLDAARAAGYPGLATLYAVASSCYTAGRLDEAVRYTDEAQTAITTGRYEPPFGIHGYLGAAYIYNHQPERTAEWCRTQLARQPRTTHVLIKAVLLLSSALAGPVDPSVDPDHVIAEAEATGNPWILAVTLLAYGTAYRDSEPDRALAALRRGLIVAHDSGNRYTESDLASSLCRLEAKHGDPLAALDCFGVAIGNFHDSGSTLLVRNPLVILADFLDRVGRYEPAAVIAGFLSQRSTAAMSARIGGTIAHLREVQGDEAYEALARGGAGKSMSAMVTYAYDEIDRTRAALSGAP